MNWLNRLLSKPDPAPVWLDFKWLRLDDFIRRNEKAYSDMALQESDPERRAYLNGSALTFTQVRDQMQAIERSRG